MLSSDTFIELQNQGSVNHDCVITQDFITASSATGTTRWWYQLEFYTTGTLNKER